MQSSKIYIYKAQQADTLFHPPTEIHGTLRNEVDPLHDAWYVISINSGNLLKVCTLLVITPRTVPKSETSNVSHAFS